MILLKSLSRQLKNYTRYLGAKVYLLLILAVVATTLEAFGIGLVLPLLSSFGDQGSFDISSIKENPALARLYEFVTLLNLENSSLGILVLISALILLKASVRFSESILGAYLSSKLHYELKLVLFSSIIGMKYDYYSGKNAGFFSNLLTEQVTFFVRSFDSFKVLIVACVNVFVYLVVVLLVSWKFAILACLSGGVLFLGMYKLNNHLKRISRESAKEQGKLNSLIIQFVQSFKYLKSTGTSQRLRFPVERGISLISRHIRNREFIGALNKTIREPSAIFLVFAIVLLNVYVLNEPIAPIVVSLILLYRAVGNIFLLQSGWQSFIRDIGSIDLIETELELLERNSESDGEEPVVSFEREIRFNNVSFRYAEDQNWVLKNMEVDIPCNSIVAIAGVSGSGKSTFIDLVTLMLNPSEGEIRVDGINSNRMKREIWRRKIGYVSQDLVMFDDTIANNIGLWAGDMNTDEEYESKVKNAAQDAAILDFILSLPQGFDTMVGERGIRLSGGQKQRLFIARELFKKPELLILDEATSALDTESESLIYESIEALGGKLTVIIVTHRLSTLRIADKIYMIDQGEIVQCGDFDALASDKDSPFQKLLYRQARNN